uniref:hypothetical protein n=1 Tax=Aeromonas salmonicida TaxID=645 RepID=UPI003399680C
MSVHRYFSGVSAHAETAQGCLYGTRSAMCHSRPTPTRAPAHKQSMSDRNVTVLALDIG